MADEVFIYGLIDPITRELRYIGKTINLDKRLKEHNRDLRRDNYKTRWISKLKRLGLSPEIVILDVVSKSTWPDAERRWIAHYKSLGCVLVNATDGGDEPPHDPETIRRRSESIRKALSKPSVRNKISEALKIVWKDDEYKKTMAKTFRENNNKPETKEKIRQVTIANWNNPEYRAKVLKACRSEKHIKGQSEKSKECWRDKDLREKFVKIRRTEEYRKKMSEVRKREWEDPEMRRKRSEAVKAAMQRPDVREKITKKRGPRKKSK